MRFLVALALLFAVTPGMTEVAESIAHGIGHGDLPHHDEAGEPLGCSEHTCTPLFHACGCHASMSAQQTGIAIAQKRLKGNATVDGIAILTSEPGRAGEPPPLRPPIS